MIEQFHFQVYIQRKQIIISKIYLHAHVHCRIIHNSKDTNQPKSPSTDELIKCGGILYNHKKFYDI